MTRPSIAATSCLLALGACSGKVAVPPPSMPSASFKAAALVEETEPLRMVAAPVPPLAPLPLPSLVPPVERLAPVPRVAAANKAALREPTGQGYVNAVQVYPWAEGALFKLYTSPEHVSEIALQPGETLISVAAGDTVRWVIGDTSSGAGEQKRIHILIKPTAVGLQTNLLISTDRRVYHLQVESTARTAMASISWTYAEDQLLAFRRSSDMDRGAAPVAGVAIENLDFAYAISGDEPPWRPLRAFDDGRQVFIEFPASLARGEAPPLFVVGAEGRTELVNYRVRDRYYVVDRLFAAAELRLGERQQQVVRIVRTGGSPAARRAAPERAGR